MWSEPYNSLANRNLGLLSEDQQETLRRSCVAVAGLGGLGGPISEMLCRLGIGSFKLLDHGTFEPTNLNRQNFCFSDTDGLRKIDVTEEYLRKINPDVKTDKYFEVTEENVEAFLDGVNVVSLSVDSVIPCLIISRAARALGLPLVEGWAAVFGNVRVFTSDTPTLEEAYEYPTIGREIASISAAEAQQLALLTLQNVIPRIPGVDEYYKPSDWQRLQEKNEGTTLAPLVWLTCTLMAIEIMKILLGWGELALAPDFASYDPFAHRIPTRPDPQNKA